MPPRNNLATGPNALEFGDIEKVTHLEVVNILVQGTNNFESTQLLSAIAELVTVMAHNREARKPVEG